MADDDSYSGKPDGDESHDRDGTERLSAELFDAIDSALGRRGSAPAAKPRYRGEPQLPPAEPTLEMDSEGGATAQLDANKLAAQLQRRLKEARRVAAEPPAAPATVPLPAVSTPRAIPPQFAPPEPEDPRTQRLEAVVARPLSPPATPAPIPRQFAPVEEPPTEPPAAEPELFWPAEESYGEDSYGEDSTHLLFADEVIRVTGIPRTTEGSVEIALEQLHRMNPRAVREERDDLKRLREAQFASVLEELSAAEEDESEAVTGVAFAEEVVRDLQQLASERGARREAELSHDAALEQLQRLRGGSSSIVQLHEAQAEAMARESTGAMIKVPPGLVFAEEVVREQSGEFGPRPRAPRPEIEAVASGIVHLEKIREERNPESKRLVALREAQMDAVISSQQAYAAPNVAWEEVRRVVDAQRAAEPAPVREEPWRPGRAFLWAVLLSALAVAQALLVAGFMWWPAINAVAVYLVLWAIPATLVQHHLHHAARRRVVLPVVVYLAFAPAGLVWTMPEVRAGAVQIAAPYLNAEHLRRILGDPDDAVVQTACAHGGSQLDMTTVVVPQAQTNPDAALRCAEALPLDEERSRVIAALSLHWLREIAAADRCAGLGPQIDAFLRTKDLALPPDARRVVALALQAQAPQVGQCLGEALPESVTADTLASLGDPDLETPSDDDLFTGLVDKAFLDGGVAQTLGVNTLPARLWTLRLGCQRLRNEPLALGTVDKLNGIASVLDGTVAVEASPTMWSRWCGEFGASVSVESLRRRVREDRLETAVAAAQILVYRATRQRERGVLYEELEIGAARSQSAANSLLAQSRIKLPDGTPAVYVDGAENLEFRLLAGEEKGREFADEALGEEDAKFCQLARFRMLGSRNAMPEALKEALGEDTPEELQDNAGAAPSGDKEAELAYQRQVRARCGPDFENQPIEFPGIEPGTQWMGPDDE